MSERNEISTIRKLTEKRPNENLTSRHRKETRQTQEQFENNVRSQEVSGDNRWIEHYAFSNEPEEVTELNFDPEANQVRRRSEWDTHYFEERVQERRGNYREIAHGVKKGLGLPPFPSEK